MREYPLLLSLRTCCLAALLVLCCSACGQKGPLYFPEPEPEPSSEPPQQPQR